MSSTNRSVVGLDDLSRAIARGERIVQAAHEWPDTDDATTEEHDTEGDVVLRIRYFNVKVEDGWVSGVAFISDGPDSNVWRRTEFRRPVGFPISPS